jgi:hypothetical protein
MKILTNIRQMTMISLLGIVFYSVSAYSNFVVTNTQGFRINNPGNIRIGQKWKGLYDIQLDNQFCTFKNVEYGIRAIGKILDTYKNKYNITLARDIIRRWAPKNENNTKKYIQFVTQYVNKKCKKCSRIDKKSYIIEAIIQYENGYQPFNHNFIIHCIK